MPLHAWDWPCPARSARRPVWSQDGTALVFDEPEINFNAGSISFTGDLTLDHLNRALGVREAARAINHP